ncbi:unnamed protein product [marine sediment metagenome]|uniref:Uncharacterized protein n=1 Tax=marine sediment metagenome TaxID=412755 RepID=X0YCW0_9ZZZZ
MSYIILLALLTMLIVIVVVAIKSRAGDIYRKRPEKDITEDAWLLEIKNKSQGYNHTAKLYKDQR